MPARVSFLALPPLVLSFFLPFTRTQIEARFEHPSNVIARHRSSMASRKWFKRRSSQFSTPFLLFFFFFFGNKNNRRSLTSSVNQLQSIDTNDTEALPSSSSSVLFFQLRPSSFSRKRTEDSFWANARTFSIRVNQQKVSQSVSCWLPIDVCLSSLLTGFFDFFLLVTIVISMTSK